jgi:hypothetical protein
MSIGVRECARVAPRLLPRLGDDFGTGLFRALDVNTRLGPAAHTDDALAVPRGRDLVIAGYAVLGRLADGVET